ncbi:MAG: diacylglycerol kinase family protein [Candidatus Aminicenantes bacterium]|nr:diacylglycerol kinase family protein [Candidatus Aminicenantes bacterium]
MKRDYSFDHLEPMAIIVNPLSASGKWERRKKARRLIEKTFKGKIHLASGGKEATINLVKKIAPGLKTLVAVGGDGTIADVLEGLKRAGCLKQILFGIIPFGSGNAFRKTFGIPKNILKAIELLQYGHHRLIDLISFEDKIAGFISVGATAWVTEEKLKISLPGFWGHVWAGRKILSLKPKFWQLILVEVLDSQGKILPSLELEAPVLDIVIAKTNYFGYSWRISPFADPEDGWLDITLFEMSGYRYILSLPSIYFGWKQKKLHHFKARRLTITGEKFPIQYNGEFLGWRKNITFEILPHALKIICPQTNK